MSKDRKHTHTRTRTRTQSTPPLVLHWSQHQESCKVWVFTRQKYRSHIDASHSRQPLVKGERLVRYEVNAVMSISQCLRTADVECCTPDA